MKNLVIAKAEATPEIHFDYSSGILEICGESYPENTATFYAPVFQWLDECLASSKEKPLTMNIEIVYFNSSSSKVLMNLFDRMTDAANEGHKIVVNWIYDAKNESGLEYGEEFKEGLESLEFNLVVKKS